MSIHTKLSRGGDGEQLWEAATALPSSSLRRFVASFGGFHEISRQGVTRCELPTPYLTVLISLADPIALSWDTNSTGPVHVTAAVVGVGCEPITTSHDGSQTVLEARLSPLGALKLFGVPASELTGQVVDLAEFWGDMSEITERLALADSWGERFQLLDSKMVAFAECGHPLDQVFRP